MGLDVRGYGADGEEHEDGQHRARLVRVRVRVRVRVSSQWEGLGPGHRARRDVVAVEEAKRVGDRVPHAVERAGEG